MPFYTDHRSHYTDNNPICVSGMIRAGLDQLGEATNASTLAHSSRILMGLDM